MLQVLTGAQLLQVERVRGERGLGSRGRAGQAAPPRRLQLAAALLKAPLPTRQLRLPLMKGSLRWDLANLLIVNWMPSLDCHSLLLAVPHW